MEDEITLLDIKEKIKEFRDERDWEQFHTPKNLSMAISIESNELMEHFLWENQGEAKEKVNAGEDLQEIKEELADILIFSLLMADSIDADLDRIIGNKLEKNKEKYPVEKSKGNAKKYTEFSDK